MTDYIGSPPAEKLIPVTTQGQPLNFDAGNTVYLWIDINKTGSNWRTV